MLLYDEQHTYQSLSAPFNFWSQIIVCKCGGCISKIMAVVTLSIQLPPSRGLCDSICLQKPLKRLNIFQRLFQKMLIGQEIDDYIWSECQSHFDLWENPKNLDHKAAYNVGNLHTILYQTKLSYTVLYYTRLPYTVLYYTILYHPLQSYNKLYYTRLYCEIL